MKKSLQLLVLVIMFGISHAQIPSSCNVPPLLYQEYERDIKNIAIRRMLQLQSPDTALVQITQNWQDTIAEGLAAIFNTTIPERDSVFNLYCIHDNTSPNSIYNGLLINVDTSYSWTQAWQSLNTLTGNSYIDSILVKYDLHLDQFFNWSFGSYALLQTDSLWNIYALIDSLEMEPGIIYGEPDAIIGGAGKISYNKTGDERYYDFYFEFNDCFDGCDNYHEWLFKVNLDCSVEYLGFVDWGVFGISPLPPPLNCNTFTSVNDVLASLSMTNVFPNPASSEITIVNKNKGGAQVLLYDITGRLLLKTETFLNSKELDLHDLPGGVYALIILNNEQMAEAHKIIKK